MCLLNPTLPGASGIEARKMPCAYSRKYPHGTCPHLSQREGENKSVLNTIFPNRKKASGCLVKPAPFRAGSLQGLLQKVNPTCIPSPDKMLGQRVCLLSCLPSLHSHSWLMTTYMPSARPQRCHCRRPGLPVQRPLCPAQPPWAWSGCLLCPGPSHVIFSASAQNWCPHPEVPLEDWHREGTRQASKPHHDLPEVRCEPAS